MFNRSEKTFTTSPQQKGVFILFGIAILLVVFVIGIVLFNRVQRDDASSSFPTPTPLEPKGGSSQEQKIAPSQKSIIDTTTQEEVENLPTIENSTPQPDGTITYILDSPYLSRKNEIITQNGQVIFERILVPEDRQDPSYVTISEFKNDYGQPQETIRGSRFYGHFIETFIYAEDGFTLIGNSYTDEVYEIHAYRPTTVENYIQQYGEDIEETTGPVL